MRRHLLIPSLATLALAAGLSACSADEEPTTAPETPGETATTQDPASEEPADEAEPTAEASPSQTAPADDPAEDPAGLTVTLDGEKNTLDLTDVYCDGAPGSLEHAIGKTDNQPPLVEVAADGFVMVKVHRQGPPEKADSPAGVTIADESVTFDDAKIGGAVLSGTMTCTSWDD